MEKFDLNNRCYQTKDDKRHKTIWGVNSIEQETPEERDKRIDNLRKSRGTWVYDPVKREVVRKEDCTPDKEVGVANVSKWDPEWTVLGTGRRMSKGELKAYCKATGKNWDNG